MKRLILAAAVSLAAMTLAVVPTAAQDGPLPLTPGRHFKFEVSSGTWMSLTISPDGKTILFDMLGELYSIPASGGDAVPIATGIAFEAQPSFSPDGKLIAYISDRERGGNLWISRPDGSGARRITDEYQAAMRSSPEWSADGKSIYVSRYRPPLDRYELWRHPIDGSPGELVVPMRKAEDAPRSEWQSTLGAIASPDGKYLYFARRVGDLSYDDPVPFSIVRRDIATGAEESLIEDPNGIDAYLRPVISPDGRLLAYAKRELARTTLRIRDLASGSDRELGPASYDLTNGLAWLDLIPRYSFTPDSSAILIAYQGKIERRPVDGTSATNIPFSVKLDLAAGPSTRVRIREETGPVRARLPMAMQPSPEGKRIAFAALGSIYVQPSAGGRSLRLPISGDAASMPGWSPDGTRITYVTWSEGAAGAVWTIAADGSAPPEKVSDVPAFFTYPVFTPDGRTILAVRSPAAVRQQTVFQFGTIRQGELVALPAAGGPARVVASGQFGQRPHFVNGQPSTVYLMNPSGLVAVDIASGAQRPVASINAEGFYFSEALRPAEDLRISPDGKWIAAQTVEQLYVMPIPGDPKEAIDLSRKENLARRITDIGADFFEWSADGSLIWSTGNWLFKMRNASAPAPRHYVNLVAEFPRAIPAGSLLLRGARALTMATGDRVIDDADILITGDRIAAIGPRGTISVPAGAAIREIGGATVVPGFIDAHDHMGSIRRSVIGHEDWGLRARLAFGITTSFDPSTLGIDQLAYQDAIDAGLMVGPRLRSTGPALFSRERFGSLDDARAVLRRYRQAWGLRNIKQYRGENRTIRQWIAIAAREQGLLPTTEGNHSPTLMLTQLLDGYAGNEHALPTAPLQEDVIKLYSLARTSYTATLLISASGPTGWSYYHGKYDPAHDPKVQRFWPKFAIEQQLIRGPFASLEASRMPALAADTAKLAASGALVGMGSHGNWPGVGFHYEMEAHTLGGMAPMAILHAATAGSAETIGRLDDMGTLEPGKFADLVVLDADPLADIRNTKSIRFVMRGGQLFDGDTLDELWPASGTSPQTAAADGAGSVGGNAKRSEAVQ